MATYPLLIPDEIQIKELPSFGSSILKLKTLKEKRFFRRVGNDCVLNFKYNGLTLNDSLTLMDFYSTVKGELDSFDVDSSIYNNLEQSYYEIIKAINPENFWRFNSQFKLDTLYIGIYKIEFEIKGVLEL